MNYSDLVCISEELGNSLSKTQVTTGDIVISQRGSLGQCAIVDNQFEKLNISANIIAIKNIRLTTSTFIRNYICSNIGQKLLERSVSGQVQQKITTQDISGLIIPLLSPDNQQKVIDCMNNAFVKRQKKLKEAEELLSNMNSYILSALNITLDGFNEKLCVAVKLCEIKTDLTFSAQRYHPERMAAINCLKSNPYITTKKLGTIVDFKRNIVQSHESTEKYLGLAGVESHTGELSGVEETAYGQAFEYESGDILYGRLRPYLNKVLLAEKSGICSTEFHVMRILDKTEILPEYLAAIMRSGLILSQTKYMMTGNTHPRISNDDVKNLYIPLPKIEIQNEIVAELTKRRNTARALRQSAEREWQEAKTQFEKELLSN